jgi:hypothetical protein
LLNRAVQSATGDREARREYVPQEWIDEATAFLETYRPKVQAITRQIGARSKEISERDDAIARLSTYVRHGWRVLKMRVARLGEPESLLRTYGLTLGGGIPQSARPDEWLQYASQFIEGDADAVAQGYEPMVNPSAAEIQAELTAASAEVADVSDADAVLDDAQATAADDAPRADELISDLVDYLGFSLRKLDGPSPRRIMRRYGIKFNYRAGETRDPDDADEA